MPNNDNDSVRRIRLLASIASFLYNEARGLFMAGTGNDIDGVELDNVVSEIETIPAEVDGYRWANAVARFLRYIVHVLSVSLQEEHDAYSARILSEINQNVNDIQLDTIFEEDQENFNGTT